MSHPHAPGSTHAATGMRSTALLLAADQPPEALAARRRTAVVISR